MSRLSMQIDPMIEQLEKLIQLRRDGQLHSVAVVGTCSETNIAMSLVSCSADVVTILGNLPFLSRDLLEMHNAMEQPTSPKGLLS